MEELEPNRPHFGHLRPTKLKSGRLPATSTKLEQMQAKDESIAKQTDRLRD